MGFPAFLQNIPEFAPRQGVDADSGFIEKQQIGRGEQCTRERELLLHAARKLPRRALHEGPEPGEDEEFADFLSRFPRRYPAELCLKLHIFAAA